RARIEQHHGYADSAVAVGATAAWPVFDHGIAGASGWRGNAEADDVGAIHRDAERRRGGAGDQRCALDLQGARRPWHDTVRAVPVQPPGTSAERAGEIFRPQLSDCAAACRSCVIKPSSRTNTSSNKRRCMMIRVNGIQIPEQKLFAEVQYHPASSRDEALDKATRALIIAELLRQRVAELGLLDAVDDADAIEDVDAIEDAIERLLAQEVVTPAASESECARYYEANQQRFVSSPLLELRHILVAAEQDAADRVAAKD